MPRWIAWLKRKMFGQYIREDGPQGHLAKAGTPTAGGVVLVGAVLAAACIWQGAFTWLNVTWGQGALSLDAWVVLAMFVAFGLMGLSDDGLKIAKKKNKGLSGYSKLAIQAVLGAGLGWYLMSVNGIQRTCLASWHCWSLGWAYPLFSALVMTATSNAINLTDGLDELAAATSTCTLLALAWLGYTTLQRPDLGAVTWLIVGGLLGFWWFNRHPARIFMGDTGSMALGGAIGTLALMMGFELLLPLLGMVFVLEALSVMLQVVSFKTTGKRVFKMSPLHHHFELSGWHEQTVVRAFTALQAACCLLGMWILLH
jgi:phospho-N-acetylmuramoyl-pentapeptide-transferase